MRRRQGRARSAAGDRAARAARGSRRRPGHQHQRRPAAGLQQHRQARRSTSPSPAAALALLAIPLGIIALARQAHLARPGVLPAGAHGPRRQAVHDRQVPLDVRRCRARDRAGVGQSRTIRASRRSGGSCAGRTSTSCRSSGTSSAATCRSSARGPERPHFVEQFKHKIPQYMLRHKVKAGLTGWAQVNGWRGNTPLEKRIEYDLYYIENWSVRLDLKIMWLTLDQRLLPQTCVLTLESGHWSSGPGHDRSADRSMTSDQLPIAPMKQRVVITGAAGFIGSHLSETLLDRDYDGHRHRQSADRRHRQHRAPRQPRLHVHQARRHQLHLHRRPGGLRAALGEPGEPDRLPRAADSDAEGRRARHAQGARAGEGEGRAVRPRVDLRGLRRSARASAEGDATGATSTRSGRAASTTRRSGSPRR